MVPSFDIHHSPTVRRVVTPPRGTDLLCVHEAVLLLDVDVVDGVALLRPRLVAHRAVGAPNHATFAPRHLQERGETAVIACGLCVCGPRRHPLGTDCCY